MNFLTMLKVDNNTLLNGIRTANVSFAQAMIKFYNFYTNVAEFTRKFGLRLWVCAGSCRVIIVGMEGNVMHKEHKKQLYTPHPNRS